MGGGFRPFRGRRSTAISKDIILKKGEIFFEVPDSGVGTGGGKIVMGDGQTRYENLPYFLAPNSGSVTNINSGAGLTGGPITSTGTLKCNLQSETKSTLNASNRTSTTNREYPVGLDKGGKLSVNVPWTDTTYENLSPAHGGADKSVVTTGEKYDWYNKQNKDLDAPITIDERTTTGVEETLSSAANAINGMKSSMSNLQPKQLSNPITVGGISANTVETALSVAANAINNIDVSDYA